MRIWFRNKKKHTDWIDGTAFCLQGDVDYMFSDYNYRIGDKIFEQDTPEFHKAVKDALFWNKLRD